MRHEKDCVVDVEHLDRRAGRCGLFVHQAEAVQRGDEIEREREREREGRKKGGH